jgi:hypothetical protein
LIRLGVVLCVVIFALSAQAAVFPCGSSCGSGHIFLENTSYPFVEDITLHSQTVTSSWTPLMTTECSVMGGGDLNGNVTFNVSVRAYMKVAQLSGVASGGRYEMRLRIDGTEIASSTRSFKHDRLNSTFLLPVSELIASQKTDVAAGRHVIELSARMVDAGSFTVEDVYVQAQGVPSSDFPSNRATILSTNLAVPTTTTQLTSNVTITNSTASNFDIIPQAQYQLTGGTPGTAMTLWFRLTQVGGANMTNSPTVRTYVPCEILSGGVCSAPSGARDGATILGEHMSVPPGTWNLALYGYAASAATSPTIAWRYVDYTALPGAILYAGTPPTYENAIQKVRKTTALTASTSSTSEQPIIWGGGCAFTKVLEMTMPISKQADDENWNGALYIDFWRDASSTWGNWSDESITIVLEATTYDPLQGYVTAEFGSYHTSLPPDGYGYFIFTSALLWGNHPEGNVVKVYVRKNDCSNAASFQVRTRSLSLKRTPADAACYIDR